MNLFQIVALNVLLLTFPILIYIIYLSTNKNINIKQKKIYFLLSLTVSFLLINNYTINTNKVIAILMLSSIVILLLLEDLYFFAIISAFIISILSLYLLNGAWLISLGYILGLLIYILKIKNKINILEFTQIFIIIIAITHFLCTYLYNPKYFSKEMFLLIPLYFFVINIICLMYGVSKKILRTHLDYKELQEEKQIRLSLFKITHEIKNPIAVIKGYLDMLDIKNTKQVKRYVPIIRSEVDRLLTILEDFLLINKTNIDSDVMDFNLMIEEILDKMDSLLKEKDIKLNLSLIDDEVFIEGDYNRLSQVFINILKNSIEAIDNKGRIYLITKIINNDLVILIEDNGIGIKMEQLNKIKEPFYTTKQRGSGLGVPLIYEIIEAHNGKVVYESKYTKGTKVTIKLPLYE